MTFRTHSLSALLAAAVLAVPLAVLGQAYLPYTPYPAPPVAAPVQGLTDSELDQLLGPIALYPDPLLSQLLPATTYPLEIVSAAQWLRDTPAPTEEAIAAQSWDLSVKALAHYPTVIADLAARIDATQAIGAAFVNQPDDLMRSIQRLRAEAQLSGALVSTPEQSVLVGAGIIQILPADPQVVYVPVYDPLVVYVRSVRPLWNVVRFGPKLRVGLWLDHDFDWRNRRVVISHFNDHRDAARPPQRWVRDQHKPAPVLPPAYVRPTATPERRGYSPPADRRTDSIAPDQRRVDVDREIQRAQHSRPGIVPVAPPPPPSPARVDPRRVDTPKPVVPPHVDAPTPPPPDKRGHGDNPRDPGKRDPDARDKKH